MFQKISKLPQQRVFWFELPPLWLVLNTPSLSEFPRTLLGEGTDNFWKHTINNVEINAHKN